MSHFSDSVSRWADSWALPLVEYRHLLYLAIMVQTAGQPVPVSTPKVFLPYLKTFQEEEYTDQTVAVATTAVVSAIKSPRVSWQDRAVLHQVRHYQVYMRGHIYIYIYIYISLLDITSIIPIQVVSTHKVNNAELQKLIALLGLLCAGDMDKFKSFQQTDLALLAKHDISADSITHSLRLLKLCNIAARASQIPSGGANAQTRLGEVTYKVIATGLGVAEDEVEMWVVDAISNGLMTATIDQLRSVVVVRYVACID